MSDYRVRSGDTLSRIARQNKTSVEALTRANNLRDPDKIRPGQSLAIPGGTPPPAASRARAKAGSAGSAVADALRQDAFSPAGTASANSNKSFPSRDGVPLFNQADAAWGTRRLGGAGEVGAKSRDSIKAQGCAITASAMAVSALSGRTITPQQMDAYLDQNKGYSGNAVKFGLVGGITGGQPPITAQRKRGTLTADGIDQQLAAGRPVLVGVNWRTQNVKTPDHWLTVTGRNADGSYRANDPNGGSQITLRRNGDSLVSTRADGAPHDYRFSGQGVTFSGGTPVRPRGNGQDVFMEAAASRVQPVVGTGVTGANAILQALQTQGASAKTAGQDRISLPEGGDGRAASQQMAQTDRAHLEKYRELFQQVGEQYHLPPALLAAIASRESRGGTALDSKGNAKFDPNGYGLMQIDRKKNPQLIRGGPRSAEHIATAAGLLQDNLEKVRRKHPEWSEAEQLRGAVAAYNMGTGNVRTLKGMDKGSTGEDYSSDVWARAQYLSSQGF